MSNTTATPDLREALENTAAALETLLAHYGDKMPAADRIQRERILSEARAALGGPQEQEMPE